MQPAGAPSSMWLSLLTDQSLSWPIVLDLGAKPCHGHLALVIILDLLDPIHRRSDFTGALFLPQRSAAARLTRPADVSTFTAVPASFALYRLVLPSRSEPSRQ